MAGSGYTVVPVQKAFTALRIIQVIIGVAVLGLSCYPVSLTSGYGSAYIFEVCSSPILSPNRTYHRTARRPRYLHRHSDRHLRRLLVHCQQYLQPKEALQLLGPLRRRVLRLGILAHHLRTLCVFRVGLACHDGRLRYHIIQHRIEHVLLCRVLRFGEARAGQAICGN
jgi:hypothetical protein